jgi:hypothetical protein
MEPLLQESKSSEIWKSIQIVEIGLILDGKVKQVADSFGCLSADGVSRGSTFTWNAKEEVR